jgi:hypothetical protein
MKLLECRRLTGVFISLALIFAFGVMTSFAQETVNLKTKNYTFTIKSEVMKVDDTEGHVIIISELKGIDVASGMVSHIKAFLDLVKGNGTVQAYVTEYYPDGSKMFIKTQGKNTTTLSPEGKPMMAGEGTGSLIKGTGKWEGFQGSQTWKLKGIAEGIVLIEVEGEYTKR